MNKIDELLMNEEVEWKKLGDVCEIKTGDIISKNFISKNKGQYPVINSGKDPLGYVNIWNTENDPIGITTRGAGVGSITYQEGKYYRGNLNYSVTIKKQNEIKQRFLYHLLIQMQKEIRQLCTFNGIPALNASELKKLIIPIPSIETQEKIVKTLDKFTNYVTELQAELQARTKQYEYYRDFLLSEEYLNKLSEQIFELEKHNEIFFAKISELCSRQKGIDITAKKMKEFDNQGAPVKIFAGGNTSANVEVEFVGINNVINKPSVIVKSRGNIDFEYYDKQFSHKNEMWSYSSLNDKKLNIKFLFYLLKNDLKYFKDNAITGKLPQISTRITDDYKIPVPDIIVQNKVVEILDKFQLLLSDTKGLLPKEIEQRQKQYEYYLEKLLTFDLKCGSKQASKQVLISRAYFNLLKEAADVVGVNLFNVEFVKLDNLLEYEQPTKYIVESTEYKYSYEIPVLTAGKTFILGYTDEKNNIYKADRYNPVIIFDDFTSGNHWIDFDFKIKSSAMKILKPKGNINFRYCYYYMQTINIDITEHKRLWISKYSQIEIPVPPIQVQEYVVSVLDKFETLINDISTGIPKEIELRQKQYEYYREKLLNFKK